jgi:hypothetical protein
MMFASRLRGDGSFPVKVAGTSHHQKQLRELVPTPQFYDLDQRSIATLSSEPGNKHDPNAVSVLIKGLHIGYLPRELAKDFGNFVRSAGFDEIECECDAMFVGGWLEVWERATPDIGVRLDIDVRFITDATTHDPAIELPENVFRVMRQRKIEDGHLITPSMNVPVNSGDEIRVWCPDDAPDKLFLYTKSFHGETGCIGRVPDRYCDLALQSQLTIHSIIQNICYVRISPADEAQGNKTVSDPERTDIRAATNQTNSIVPSADTLSVGSTKPSVNFSAYPMPPWSGKVWNVEKGHRFVIVSVSDANPDLAEGYADVILRSESNSDLFSVCTNEKLFFETIQKKCLPYRIAATKSRHGKYLMYSGMEMEAILLLPNVRERKRNAPNQKQNVERKQRATESTIATGVTCVPILESQDYELWTTKPFFFVPMREHVHVATFLGLNGDTPMFYVLCRDKVYNKSFHAYMPYEENWNCWQCQKLVAPVGQFKISFRCIACGTVTATTRSKIGSRIPCIECGTEGLVMAGNGPCWIACEKFDFPLEPFGNSKAEPD